ncbi:hypothetical protein CHU98_g4199 [Xylaria longipes]|nr:hypothetical protein CHU98_g4199 [Xylaria longipes]
MWLGPETSAGQGPAGKYVTIIYLSPSASWAHTGLGNQPLADVVRHLQTTEQQSSLAPGAYRSQTTVLSTTVKSNSATPYARAMTWTGGINDGHILPTQEASSSSVHMRVKLGLRMKPRRKPQPMAQLLRLSS